MKYLLLIFLVLLVFWLWRSSQRARSQPAQPQRRAPQKPVAKEITEMVACDVCQVHLPRAEALSGPGGVGIYCSEAHRREAGA